MTLHALVAVLGGDLYHGGARANVPAPGHSAQDRSISLLLSEGRVVIHGFGSVDWRAMRDDLRGRGFIDDAGRLTGAGHAGASAPRPDHRLRSATAARLWEKAVPVASGNVAGRHLKVRAIRCGASALNLRHLAQAPISVYRPCAWTRPALIARISDGDDRLTAVELTYLDPNGRPAAGLHLKRKTVGHVPPGASVRLAPAAEAMLVGEGVATTLSASERFGLPGWALLAANNLVTWSPPPCVRRVLIAADRGTTGEGAALRLLRRLRRDGIQTRTVRPALPFGDWNEVAMAARPESA